ncbi:MAG TPA: DUF2269 family protein [Actinomycetota bacterium]|nr:DUF2269 family protein [Actinomycetota bacterium]
MARAVTRSATGHDPTAGAPGAAERWGHGACPRGRRTRDERRSTISRTAWIHLFVFLHVLGAIAAVGPTLTYGLLAFLGERRGAAHRAFALDAIGWIDRHLATPAFVLQAGTGSALIFLARWPFFQTAWLLTGVAIYAFVAVVAVTVYAPLVRRQRALAHELAAHPDDRALAGRYGQVARRSRNLGLLIVVLTLAIVYLMVAKPTLWSAG